MSLSRSQAQSDVITPIHYYMGVKEALQLSSREYLTASEARIRDHFERSLQGRDVDAVFKELNVDGYLDEKVRLGLMGFVTRAERIRWDVRAYEEGIKRYREKPIDLERAYRNAKIAKAMHIVESADDIAAMMEDGVRRLIGGNGYPVNIGFKRNVLGAAVAFHLVEVRPQLIQILTQKNLKHWGDSVTQLRIATIKALLKLGDRQDFFLLEALYKDKNEKEAVRLAALGTLKTSLEPERYPVFTTDKVKKLPFFRQQLKEAVLAGERSPMRDKFDKRTLDLVIDGTRLLGDPESVPLLEKVALGTTFPVSARVRSMLALHVIDPDRSPDRLEKIKAQDGSHFALVQHVLVHSKIARGVAMPKAGVNMLLSR